MPFTFTMPKLTPTMESGVIAKWHKKEGDFVASGELIIEVTTDKATVEHTVLDEGYIRKILQQEGSEILVNTPLAILTEKKDESIKDYVPEGVVEKEPVKVEAFLPDENASESVEISNPTTTATLSQPAFVPEEPLENYEFNFPLEEMAARIKASPLAKKLAKEKGLDLSIVKGSGPHGRIVEKDLENAQKSGILSFGRREKPKYSSGAYGEEPLSPVQKIVANRLQQAKSFIPHFYLSQNIDAEPMMLLRNQLKSYGVKLSFNDFILKASALALKKHPKVNSGFNSQTESIIYFKTIDISIAVSLEEGLITPILRYADLKNIGEISVEVKLLAKKAREGKLALNEFKGGSFCISNVGMYGVTALAPIINPPQSAILGVGGVEEIVRMKEGCAVQGYQMTLTLAVDHRSVNGADGAEFMKTLKVFLENPAGLLV